jgi:hypothetical protein
LAELPDELLVVIVTIVLLVSQKEAKKTARWRARARSPKASAIPV